MPETPVTATQELPEIKRGQQPQAAGSTTIHTVKTAAEFVRMHPKTVIAHLRSGDLKGHQRVRGGDWRIFESDLVDWIKRPRPKRRRRNA